MIDRDRIAACQPEISDRLTAVGLWLTSLAFGFETSGTMAPMGLGG